MNLWQERQPRSVSSTDLPKCMEALQCSNAVTIETVVCRLNLNHGGMTYAMHQGCFLCVVDLAVCTYISHASELVGPCAAVEIRECTFA
jgi:transketolase C-terminal domain/subunit